MMAEVATTAHANITISIAARPMNKMCNPHHLLCFVFVCASPVSKELYTVYKMSWHLTGWSRHRIKDNTMFSNITDMFSLIDSDLFCMIFSVCMIWSINEKWTDLLQNLCNNLIMQSVTRCKKTQSVAKSTRTQSTQN